VERDVLDDDSEESSKIGKAQIRRCPSLVPPRRSSACGDIRGGIIDSEYAELRLKREEYADTVGGRRSRRAPRIRKLE